MRVKEELKRSGFFWLPKTPENKIPGTLIIVDSGKITLDVVGPFDNSPKGMIKAINGPDLLGRVVGYIEKEGLVTLEDCIYINKNLSFSGGTLIFKSSIRANKALLGIEYEENEAVVLNTFQFSVEGIDEWAGISGIKVEYNFEKRTAKTSYEPPEEIEISLDNGIKLLITYSWNLPNFSAITEAKTTHKTYFKLVSKEERPLDDFISTAHKLTTLLCFAIDKTVSIEQITVTSYNLTQNTGKGDTYPVPITIYYPSQPYSSIEPLIDKHFMLFRYSLIKDTAENAINNWLAAYDKIEPAINLFFSARTGAHKYLDGNFLALVQGLETYHRRTSSEKIMDEDEFNKLQEILINQCPNDKRDWLSGRLQHGNEYNLGRRIKSILEPFKKHFGTNVERNKLIRCIVDTRNYLTHYDKSLESSSAKGRDLWLLNLRLETLFQLHLLKLLGFNTKEIKSIFDNSQYIQQKMKEN